jgi:molybdopterin-containing oxidoreductase family membrane subunit
MDFAASQVPGWHSTIFPPYFVAGAIFSGFAMVLTLAIPLRKFYHLEDLITIRHIENSAKLMLVTGMIVAYGYTIEWVIAWYSGDKFEWFMTTNRAFGPYATYYWMLIFCNILVPQLMWFKSVRQNVAAMWVISIIINIGMWLERFVIVVISLTRDYMPSSWGMYHPTFWDISTFVGTIGMFLCCIFLFVRVLPMISIFEMRELVHMEAEEHAKLEEGK